jgi:hypothetical protein
MLHKQLEDADINDFLNIQERKLINHDLRNRLNNELIKGYYSYLFRQFDHLYDNAYLHQLPKSKDPCTFVLEPAVEDEQDEDNRWHRDSMKQEDYRWLTESKAHPNLPTFRLNPHAIPFVPQATKTDLTQMQIIPIATAVKDTHEAKTCTYNARKLRRRRIEEAWWTGEGLKRYISWCQQRRHTWTKSRSSVKSRSNTLQRTWSTAQQHCEPTQRQQPKRTQENPRVIRRDMELT